MLWGSRPASQQRGQASARLGGPVDRRSTPRRAPASGQSGPTCRTGAWRLQAVAKRPTAGFRGRTAFARSRPDTTPRQRRPCTQVRTAGRAEPPPVRAEVDQHRPRLQGCESMSPRADACGPGNGWRLAAAGRSWIYALEVGRRVSGIRCRVSTSCPIRKKDWRGRPRRPGHRLPKVCCRSPNVALGLRPLSGRSGKTGCWKRRQSCRSAGPKSPWPRKGGTDQRRWQALAHGSTPAYMALECELQLIGSPGLGGAARQLLSAHPVPRRVVEPLRQCVRPACWKAGSLVGLR